MVLTVLSGRLLYTSGNVADAVRIFLELLKLVPGGLTAQSSNLADHSSGEQETTAGPEKIFLEDFRMALSVCKNLYLNRRSPDH